jgi:DNA-binding NtrC family response regulator
MATNLLANRHASSQPSSAQSSAIGRQLLILGSQSGVPAFLSQVLREDGFNVSLMGRDQALIRLQKRQSIEAVLLELVESHSLQTLAAIRELCPTLPILVFSSLPHAETVVKVMKLGASDYIQMPFGISQLKESVRQHLALVEGGASVEEAAHETVLSESASFVCASNRMNEIRGQCAILARVDLPVLILGESGTGKEILAMYLHKMSPRAHRTFLKVNCAAMPADLLESELFGYEQGAFTGAVRSKPGRFEICNMGTILLDEIGEMPVPLQSKLLQVLQDGTFSRLGGRTCIKVDVRVIAATNIDMNAAIAARTFREDLYYRLSGFSIQMPPLRERKEEIPILVRHFMQKLSAKYARQPLVISETLMNAFVEHEWPGNLRELENYVKRYLVLGDDRHILNDLKNARGSSSVTVSSRPAPAVDPASGLKGIARSAMGVAETEIMSEVLIRNNWNRKQAANELKISYKALLYKIRQYGLSPTQDSRPASR